MKKIFLILFLSIWGMGNALAQNFLDERVQKAIENTDLPKLKALVKEGVDINLPNLNEMTPLASSLYSGRVDIAKYLIENGANVNYVNRHGMSILALGISSKNMEMIKLVVKNGADVNYINFAGMSILTNCISFFQTDQVFYTECLTYLLSLSKLDKEAKLPHLTSALHFAVMTNNNVAVDILLEEKAKANVQNSWGETPLTVAVTTNKAEIVQLFVKHKKGLKAKNKNGKTALELAKSLNRTELITILEKKSEYIPLEKKDQLTVDEFIQLSIKNLQEAIEQLDKVQDLNQQDKNGYTLLTWACQLNSEELIEILLKKGVDPNISSKYLGTGLHVLSSYENPNFKLINLFFQYKINPNAKDHEGNTALHYCAKSGSLALAQFLVAKGTKFDTRNKDGETAEEIAKANHHLVTHHYLKNPKVFQNNIVWQIKNIFLKSEQSNFIKEEKKALAQKVSQTAFDAKNVIEVQEHFQNLGQLQEGFNYLQQYKNHNIGKLLAVENRLLAGEFIDAKKLFSQIRIAQLNKEEQAWYHYINAYLSLEKGKFQKARQEANRSLALAQDRLLKFKAQETLGLSCLATEDFDTSNKHLTGTFNHARSLAEMGKAYHSLAKQYWQYRFHSMSQKFTEKVLGMYHQSLGVKHPIYLDALRMYANILRETNEYIGADFIYRHILKSIEKEAGKTNIRYLVIRYEQAQLYEQLGNFQQAIDLLEESHEIATKNQLTQYSIYIDNTLKLASFYRSIDDFDKSLAYTNEAIGLIEKMYGKRNKRYAEALHNLGLIHIFNGKYAEAEKALLTVRKATKNKFHLQDEASLMLHLGVLYQVQKQYSNAETAYLQAFGNKDIDVYAGKYKLKALTNLSKVYLTTQQYNKAQKRLLELEKIEEERIQNTFPILSEKEKELFYYQIKEEFNLLNALLVFHHQKNDSLKGLIYNHQLNYKALLLHQSIKVKNKIMSSKDSVLIGKYQQWQKQKRILSKVTNIDNLGEKEKKQLIALEKNTNQLEKELSLATHDFQEQSKNTKWQEVRNKLKEGEAAVEMVRCTFQDSIFYYALVIHKNSTTPEFVPLENGTLLENDDYFYYKNCIQYQITDERSFMRYFQKIYEHLPKGTKHIYFSPDGVFNKISLNTLYDNTQKKFLVDFLQIQLVTNTKEVLSNKKYNKSNTPVLFGRPKYEGVPDDENQQRSFARNTRLQDIFGEMSFTDLPGTETEVNAISKLFAQNKQDVQLFLQEKATEQNLKNIQSPSILHLATHGFFFSDHENEGEVESENNRSFSELHELLEDLKIQAQGTNPMTRSGIILTGAGTYLNTKQDSTNYQEDGIFTAFEALSLSLDETQLVVLSACETGLGDVVNGEGVYGLQRALKIAGTQNILMSLWKVDDEATQKLMRYFYQYWLESHDKRKAFTMAQQSLKKEYPLPYYWGAFVLIGN
ncbi:MAG: CHAT domain-containing protein [Cytophagales bacterium]|nr:CHAT domain-containing protein [Cytophagales bacterium]